MEFQDQAIEASLKSMNKYHKHGALLIRNGRIIASGCNKYSSHAEVSAINKGLQRVLPGSWDSAKGEV